MDLDDLRARVGTETVVTDPDRMAGHVRDWTGRWVGRAAAVVFPRSIDHVISTVQWCRTHGVGLVPQGGNTGLVGGSIAMNGEVVLSLTRMTDIAVGAEAGLVFADAGATVAAVHHAAAAVGWRYGVDFGARDTATIGGTIATNAGGIHVMRHGNTRAQLLGVQAVTGAGEVVGDLRGLVKDNTGYHLPSLLAGSEGTLAVVTRACLRLLPPVEQTAVAMLGFASADAAIEAVSQVRLGVADLQALELFFADGLELVCTRLGLADPLPQRCGAYLLAEVGGPAGVVERLALALENGGVAADAVAVGTDAAQQARLWRYREGHTEAIAMVGVPHKLDVTVPLPAMGAFVADVRAVVSAHDATASTWLFGHAGDGNIHVNITGLAPDDSEADALVLDLVVAAGGSISAEHGVGRAKASYLHLNRSDAERALARRIKTAFDPDGILNPGVLLT